MQDRFRFRAIVKGYYYIDTPEKYEEFEPLIFLENIDVLDIGDIGISEEDLEISIRKQYPDLQDVYIERIMENFRDNSKGIDTYITITPEQIYQCTGLKDKNGKLIYEGDIVRFKDCNDILVINHQKEMACFAPQFYYNGGYGGRLWFDDYDSFECQFYKSNNFEVIGNIYDNPELLED